MTSQGWLGDRTAPCALDVSRSDSFTCHSETVRGLYGSCRGLVSGSSRLTVTTSSVVGWPRTDTVWGWLDRSTTTPRPAWLRLRLGIQVVSTGYGFHRAPIMCEVALLCLTGWMKPPFPLHLRTACSERGWSHVSVLASLSRHPTWFRPRFRSGNPTPPALSGFSCHSLHAENGLDQPRPARHVGRLCRGAEADRTRLHLQFQLRLCPSDPPPPSCGDGPVRHLM